MQNIMDPIDPNSVQYDAEFFMANPDDPMPTTDQGEGKREKKQDMLGEILGQGDKLLGKVDKMLTNIGL